MSLFCVTHNLPSQTLKLVCSYFLWVKNPTTIDYQLIVFLSLSLSLFVHEYTHTIIVIVSDETLCRSIQSQIIRNRPSSITLRWTSNPCLIDYNQSPVDIKALCIYLNEQRLCHCLTIYQWANQVLCEPSQDTKEKIVCLFSDFLKVFGIVPKEWLPYKLHALTIPSDMMCPIHALCAEVLGWIAVDWGYQNNTWIHWCKATMNNLPILFGLYLDKACGGSKGIGILDTPIFFMMIT